MNSFLTKPSLLIFLIFLIGLFLRLGGLNVSPPGFNADEAALGYNAYSILQTGRDEWGTTLPLVFKSFSDYKPGLYVYLSVPFIWLFGLNELAVRLPSIILGSFAVIFVYLLSKSLFKKEIIALSTAFLLAVSPWHLHYSRGAWETNVATFFILAAVLCFVKGLKNNQFFTVAGLLFLASMYAYQSPRLIVPVLVILLIIFYFKDVFTKKIIIPIILTAIFLIPLIFIMTSNTGLARFQGVSIFSDVGPINRINEQRGEDTDPNSLIAKFYHNKIMAYGSNFLIHYLDHFSLNFLFLTGDPLGRNRTPEMGQFFLFEIATILIGIYFLLKKGFEHAKIILIWLLVAPLAAALTYQTPHALRAHNMVIPLNLISGLGLGILIEKLLHFKGYFRYVLLPVAFLPIAFFLTVYFHQYYVHLPKQYALEWENGFSKLIPYLMENQNKYQKVVITDRYDQPYILLLFYSQFEPQLYQSLDKKIGDNKFGFSTVTAFDKFEFRPISQEEMVYSKGILFVGTEEEIEKNYIPDKIISFPNGKQAFKVVGT